MCYVNRTRFSDCAKVTMRTHGRLKIHAPIFCLLLLGLTALFVAEGLGATPTLEPLWRLDGVGLDRTESVVYDDNRDRFYISNIVGESRAKDRNGFIAAVSREGELIELRWVVGLNGPKGMAIFEKHLFVSDIDELIEIDIEKRKIIKRHSVLGAINLNDVSADKKGQIYVSDSRTHIIHRFAFGEIKPWFLHESLVRPNGIRFIANHLIVAAGQPGIDDPGRERFLHKISMTRKRTTIASERFPLGNLDGVEPDNRGGYFVTSGRDGEIMHVGVDGRVVVLLKINTNASDLAYVPNHDIIILPLSRASGVMAFRVVWN